MIFFIRLHLGYFGFLLYFHVNLLFRTAGNSTLQQFLLLRVVYGGDCDNLILGIVCWDILSLLLLEECGLHCLLAGISLLLGYTLCGLLSNYILINLFEIITIFLIHLMTADVSCKGLDLSDLFLCAINLCQIAFGIGHFISIKYLWRILMDITICIYQIFRIELSYQNRSLQFIYRMNEQTKIGDKQIQKRAVVQRRQYIEGENLVQGMLNIHVFPLSHRIKQNQNSVNRHSESKKDRRSQKIIKQRLNVCGYQTSFRIKPSKQKNNTIQMKAPKKQILKQQTIIDFKQTDRVIQKQKSIQQRVDSDSMNKKMKIGKRNKSNAMKQFILQTLLKAKAQGTCYVMHRGNNQLSNSPLQQRKSLIKNNAVYSGQKQVPNRQENRYFRKNNAVNTRKPSLPAQKSLKNTQLGGHFDSNNKKWVQMIRQFENRKHKKIPSQIPQQIQQQLQNSSDPKMHHQIQQMIAEQIQVEQSLNQDSLIK